MKTENKLIAEFMGMERERHSDGRYLFTTDLEEAKGIDTRFTEELYFHISWDWLMEVVDKIEGQQTDNGLFEFRIHIEKTLIVSSEDFTTYIESDGGNRFENTYSAVVKFIIEYNKNK